ncbi:hypothetical protein IKF04_02205 [Candidatus Saccharibacteria bacterium]|nr:hypothetical protein [Candidatus Saccharibacteria bacterium]
MMEKIIGIKINPGKFERKYCVGDAVEVTGDIYGYICPGITSPGTGKIIEVHRDSTDGFLLSKWRMAISVITLRPIGLK